MTAAAVLLAALAGQASPPPATLKPGDLLRIQSPMEEYRADLPVMSDGAIYPPFTGRLVVSGRTLAQAEVALRTRMARFVRPERLQLVLVTQRKRVVYLLGAETPTGEREFVPGLTLRQAAAGGRPPDRVGQVTVSLYRKGRLVKSQPLEALLRSEGADVVLQPEDVVTFAPRTEVGVWVTGLVARPGRVFVPVEADVQQAIAEAGGFTSANINLRTDPSDVRITVRRGPETTPVASAFPLREGDTVIVEGPRVTRFTVGGEVAKPGELEARGDVSVLQAVSQAGGPTVLGTLKSVLVLRGTEMFRYDVTDAAKPVAPPLQNGDLVFVQRNEDYYYVLGSVNRPGRALFRDGIRPRVSDALAEAGGIVENRGVLRRVILARANAEGKVVPRTLNYDDFVKKGDLAQNPEILPGDVLLFDSQDNLSAGNLINFLSSIVILDNLFRRR